MTDFSKEYQTERVESLIEEFRLQKVRKSLGIQLSGGERRRTEIARAVAINPAFILLDARVFFLGSCRYLQNLFLSAVPG